ncbi:50S ribosomal protein L25 [Candidatus Roizmanbacteria bacterium CG_4_10_14_0_2_um_filter_36_35]|uniref:Large ribosomal subunit protein bL25 n=4 Tax=Candidatus Roizmaniibacteriota TaxID=1752723 RepID=A0A2M7BXL1_9BACT|nr:MAG: 50S ribosomal protein L25 [Candidatus Roizmanbacteria bacterium CG11_big_fil_rev_8_21_14_0_20_35_14]PIV11304.1 MAG: 50S ribosomal protein L25 [Candidatus Roizmanbacteria bacterium CG03_land_8_20_14_0_80_35_26]PIZ68838.1 MAG: 50S ribosomal protein L25 [Candidatus Roizmanbacteria bacterium CG_4_10_14_0_2_um_filter_36_35]PJB87817.1 MAG: 50S ribosomal protein L25 [Candidatus Roizmanbacteria bacterium CG_4_9_14_0_8_um_filter_34_12]PJC80334.1 MAG: 50S ribosomal protein L25 [Candidatus Roizman
MKKTASDKLTLELKNRELTGKKAKKLRKEGLILANIYGPEFKSQSVSVDSKVFAKTYRTARETAVVYLKLNKDEIPVLIKNIQKHPVTDMILHVDFRKIDLKKKIQTGVPIKVVGASEAVSQKAGVLLIQSETILVEALPQNIPSHIEVNISIIKDIGQEIKVADLKKSDRYEIKTSPEKVVVSVVEHKEESITPDTTAAAAPEVITEAPVEDEEGAPAKTGETAATQEKGKPTEIKPEAKGKPSKPEGKPAENKPATPAPKK